MDVTNALYNSISNLRPALINDLPAVENETIARTTDNNKTITEAKCKAILTGPITPIFLECKFCQWQSQARCQEERLFFWLKRTWWISRTKSFAHSILFSCLFSISNVRKKKPNFFVFGYLSCVSFGIFSVNRWRMCVFVENLRYFQKTENFLHGF
jgi:hypothetical protein